ncbi:MULTISPECIES: hypothetical protein [Microcystis]|nr:MULTISPECIES: hypothetical protein [Microcystis]BCU13677.1 hypothetical protein MAN88_42410 [Microcystis aeruginosa]
MSLSFKVSYSDSDFLNAQKQALLDIVAERNKLIHQDLAPLGTSSIEDYYKLISLLDEQNPRLLAHLEELGWMLTSCIEGLKDLQEFIKSPDFLANPIPNKCVYRERRQTLSVIMQTVGHTLSPGKTFSADPSYYRKFVLKTPSF